MKRLKEFLFRKFYVFFKTEIQDLVKKIQLEFDRKIKYIQAEADRNTEMFQIAKEALKDEDHIIVGIEHNKKNEEVFVVQWCFKSGINECIWFMLYGKEYRACNRHPRIMATYYHGILIDSPFIKIDDILVEDNNIGNGSILMPYFLEYCKKTDAKYICGELASVDSGHFDRSIHFYEKHGFKCTLNVNRTSGGIHYEL